MKSIRRAKVIVKSRTIDTYANVFAAIALRGDIDEIVLVSTDEKLDDHLFKDIFDRLRAHDSLEPYAKAARLKVSEERWSEGEIDGILGNCDLVDVTAASKQLAIVLATKALTRYSVKVCDLLWIDRFDKEIVFRVGNPEHRFRYADLFGEGAAKAVRQDYFAKKHVLVTFFATSLGVVLAALAAIFFGVSIPDNVVSVMGLLIGLGGLYLAYLSLQHR